MKTIEEKFEEWFSATGGEVNDELDYEATKKKCLKILSLYIL